MIIRNGKNINANETFFADIRIDESTGKISEIAQNITERDGEKIIDANGLLVIPGGVDVHTHLDLDVGSAKASDDFYTGTVAAAYGGTTTIVDHIGFGPKNCALKHQIDVYHKLAKNKAVIDYSFHGVVQHVNDEILGEIESLIKEGITSYKIYLTYDFKLGDAEIFRFLKKAKELGVLTTFHAENHEVIQYLREDFKNKGMLSPKDHANSRPIECEAEAISRVLLLAKMAGNAPIYIVHLSGGLGLDYINMAHARGQKNVFVETCPQYLLLDESVYDLPIEESLKYTISPPLRSKNDNEILWKGLAHREINTIATDHCPFFLETQKSVGKDDFTKCPNGAPGIETRMPLIFSKGVSEGRITANHFVELCCQAPAKLFGLYPQKGVIKVGSDADIVIIDPEKKVVIKKENLHENVDYTPYEGFELTGVPVMTISRGEIIVENNKFAGKKGRGEFIKRKSFEA